MTSPWRAGETVTATALNACRVCANYTQTGAGQSIPTATDRRILFNTALKTNSAVTTSTVSSGTVFTLGLTGWWRLEAGWRMAAGASALRYAAIANGSDLTERYASSSQVSNNVVAVALARSRYFTAGASVCLMANQVSGGALSLETTFDEEIFFALTWEGA